jgi:aminopeptidase-like protein
VLPPADELHARVAALLPLPRSLTGPGVEATLAALGGDVEVHEVASGTPVLDWAVPDEWVLRSARLTGPGGEVVADAADHPLSVLGYSEPVDVEVELEQLQPHLHSDPAHPDAIPYRTSYYSRRWGFCLPHRRRAALPPGRYRAVVDADLRPGAMRWGERVLPGSSGAEVLVTSHVCHPGMANDNASGNVVAAALADHLAARPARRLTWRFLWLPGTIGEIAWIARHADRLAALLGGMVLAGVGDRAPLAWKRSRRGGPVDRAVLQALRERGAPHDVRPWSPWGYAERQFNSLGVDVPVGRLSRAEHGTYPEYHTSADDAAFVTGASLREALEVAVAAAEALEANATYRNLRPVGEPRLGPRGLFDPVGGRPVGTWQLALLWVLSESDGATDLLAVAERSGLPVADLAAAAEALLGTDLLAEVAAA